MEYEYYEDVIDAYEAGIGVEEGDSLTDYIKKNNIKIINIEPFRPTESKADGGSVGIEVLFGPKVPAAPSQLVSESDILLGYRGDAAYRSGSEQSKSIGQGNVGSKASFGGGQGTDRSGRSEGASGARMSPQLEAQRYRNMVDRNTPKEPNIIDKIVDNPLAKLIDPRSKIALAMGGYKFLRDGIPKLKDFEDESIDQELKNIQTMGGISPYADGGRVGFFMGGPALEGEALSIYNSMSAYGNTDQQIADKLQSLGMYTPGGSTPDPTPDPGQTIGYQGDGGGGSGGITTLDPLTRKSNPLDPNSFFGKISNKLGGFKDSVIDKFSGTKVGEGITEGATKFKNFAITPMMALANIRNPLNPNALNYNPALQPQMDFLEGITGTRVSGMPEDLQFTEGLMMIGRDPDSGLTKYGPGSVLSGKNVVSGFGTNDYGEMLRDYITKMEANTRISQAGKDARLALARAELEAEQERQRQAYIDAGTQKEVRDLQKEIDSGKYSGGSAFAQANQAAVGGGNTATNAQGQTAAQATAAGTGTSQGYSQHYARGGLATMFTRRR